MLQVVYDRVTSGFVIHANLVNLAAVITRDTLRYYIRNIVLFLMEIMSATISVSYLNCVRLLILSISAIMKDQIVYSVIVKLAATDRRTQT